jgi:hypothetical protein
MPRADLSREKMLALVSRIMQAEETEAECDANVELFVANCKHPDGSDLIAIRMTQASQSPLWRKLSIRQ